MPRVDDGERCADDAEPPIRQSLRRSRLSSFQCRFFEEKKMLSLLLATLRAPLQRQWSDVELCEHDEAMYFRKGIEKGIGNHAAR